MNILISSPYATHSLHGNTISANRIASMLTEVGHQVSLIQSGSEMPSKPDALIALHAKKSYATLKAVSIQFPAAKIILYLTGTDLYDDLPNGCQLCVESLELADAIVVSQEASYDSVPQVYQNKTSVVYNSIELPDIKEVEAEPELFTIASHLRAVKQPFLVVDALQLLERSVRVKLLGSEIDSGAALQAQECMEAEPRFEWLGEQSHADTIHWMQRSAATINTSLAEGGANSVGESIVLGRPVLASKIEGNIGMLGADYDGYFDPASASELAELMAKILTNQAFKQHLEQQVTARSEKYSRSNEREGWLALLEN